MPAHTLAAACQPQPPVADLSDCRLAGIEVETGNGRSLFWQRATLIYDSPFYGTYNNAAALDLIVDVDAPTSSFVNLPSHVRANEVVIIGGEAGDPTSSVAQVEVRISAGAYETAASGANAASWSYALNTGSEGLLALSVRATDAAENTQSPATTDLVVVDGTAPQAAANVANGIVLAPQQQADGSWTLALSGTVADPTIVGRAGSGVASLEVAVAPAGSNGRNWQPLTWDGSGNWQIDYPLADSARTRAPFALTGPYDIHLRAADALGNSAEQVAAAIGIDNRPPTADLDLIGNTAVTLTTLITDHPILFDTPLVVTTSVPAVISDSVTLSGGARDTGPAVSGVPGVDVSYTPLDFLTSPFTDTAVQSPLWQPTTVTPVSPTLSTWETAVPEGLEGFFHIDARATDGVGNTTPPAAQPQWVGEIDTNTPRITATLSYAGWASTARTEYAVAVEDLNVVEDGFRFDVCLPPGSPLGDANRGYLNSAWADAFLPTPRQTQINVDCIVPGLNTEAFRVNGCDVFGRCTGRDFDPDFNLYVADNSRVLTRTDSLGAGAETTAVLDSMNRPVYAISDGALTYIANNDTPAAAIRRSNLDGSADTLLAHLRPGSGSASLSQPQPGDLDFRDDYGAAVAFSADGLTMAVSNGNVYSTLNGGTDAVVYVYERTAAGWTLANTLTTELTDGGATAFLSSADSVAVNADGSVIVIGASAYDSGGQSSSGAVIVYERPGTSWSDGLGSPTPVARLVASDAAPNARLGHSVTIDGATVVAGVFSGSGVYVFAEPGGGWASGSESQKLTLPATGLDSSVAIDGDWLAAAHSNGAYVYQWNISAWTPATTLPGATGPGVALDGGTLVANNAVFTYDGSSWAAEATLPAAANSVALHGNVAVLGDTGSGVAGTARVFVRRAGSWLEHLRLTPANGAGGDLYGTAVAIISNTLAVGAPEANTVGQGSLYLYDIGGDGLILPSPTAENDGGFFGRAIAVSGDTLVLGGPLAQRPATSDVTGAAEVFVRRDNVWTWQQTLFASDGQSGDQFGSAVAIDGDTLIVGAPNAQSNTGVAYAFARSGDVWTQQGRLLNGRSDPGFFGRSVGVSGDTAVIGAPGNNSNDGQVYVYTRSGGSWSYAATLVSNDTPGTANRFGWDVAIDGDTIVAAPQNTDSAFVFVRPGGGWTSSLETARLQATGDSLTAIAVSGDDVAALGTAVHLFTRPGGGWGGTLAPQHTFTPADARSVALDGDRLVVGAFDTALVYTRDFDGVWSAAAPLTVDTPISVDFGRDVAVSGGVVVVAAEQTNGATGAAYAFDSVSVTAVAATASTVVWTQETAAGQALLRHDVGASPWQRAMLAGPTTAQVYRDVAITDDGSALYWSESDTASPTQGRIQRAILPDGGGVTTLIATGSRPHSLALNELDRKLYWTADLDGSIHQANLDGSGAITLYGGRTTPTGIALLPVESAVYWVEQAAGATVMRGDLAQTPPTAVFATGATLANIATDQNYLPIATDQTVSTAVNEPLAITLDAYDPDDDPLTFALVNGPNNGILQGPLADVIYVPGDDFSGSDSFTYRADDGRGGSAEATVTILVGVPPAAAALAASGTYTTGTNLTLNIQPLADYTPNPRDSVIFTPTNGAVITTLDPIDIAGAAYAFGGLQGLILFANNNVIAAIPYNGVITDTTWTTTWTPPGDGRYVLESAAVETGSILEGARTPITIMVDTLPPSVSIDSTVISISQQIAGPLVEVSGTAADLAGVSRVEFRYETPGQGYGPWQLAEYDPATERWRYAFDVGTVPDSVVVFIGARAIDYAGNVAETGDAIEVDLVPPTAVDFSVAHNGAPLAAGDLVPLAQADLDLTWSASSDGSGFVDYAVGWSDSPDTAVAWQESAGYSGAGQHTFTIDEAQLVYLHLRLTDFAGNQRVQTVGPIAVDGPLTPDLVSGLDVDSWRQSGNTLLSSDYEIRRNTSPNGALHQPQQLYGSWDADALRLTWQGANWDSHGDLFFYLDSGSGGALAAYDPFTPAAPPIELPAGFGANYAIHVQSTLTATLLAWNGGIWTPVQALDSDAYRFTTSGGQATSDILLPFALVGIADPANSSLGVVALATEEGTLRPWAAAPDQNPLNSTRVIDDLAAGYTANGYALTQALSWPSLGSGIAPNGGNLPGSDLHVSISATPGGVSAGYLASDWLDLLTPGTPLDADLDGVPDVALPTPAAPLPLGDGSAVAYTLHIRNEGTETAENVQVALTPRGALALDTAGPINVGAIAAGDGVTVTIDATVSTALAGDAAELNGVVSDGRHGAFEWFWAHHPVDTAVPTDLAITAPITYVLPFTNTIAGVVNDPGGVPTIGIMIRPIPSNEEGFTTCTDPTPYDGAFQCPLNLGDLAGLTAVEIRVRATDSFGQTGPWTAWKTLVVDDTPPTLSLTTDVETLLQDGYLAQREATWQGTLSDDVAPQSVEVCVAGACVATAATTGSWQLSLPLPEGDGIAATVVFTGTDRAGNLSLPLTQEIVVDTVPPVLTVTQALDTIDASSNDTPVLAGTHSDGGGLAEIYARVQGPDGVVWTAVSRDATTWAFVPEELAVGNYTITLQAYDRAGNGRSYGPFALAVVENGHTVYLPVVINGR